MNHVGTVRGQSALGRSPEAAHTSTMVKPAGKVRTGSANDGSTASTASTTRKKSGAATWTPTNEIGRASCRERVWDSVEAVTSDKKQAQSATTTTRHSASRDTC